ncbi:hypothetical protein LNW72_40010 [Streptomyces sp. RKAG293]|nr:hypothetical protein [Streptomyces sp. RKAG293]
MVPVVLVGLLVVAAVGCVCVVWAERGGPRWVRAVASMTLTAGGLLRRSRRRRRRSLNSNSGGGD